MTTVIRGTDNSASAPAVAGTDGDTGLYFPAANQVALATNGTQAVFVDSSQNVGIGTSSPGVRLDIKGSSTSGQIRFAGSGSIVNRLYGDDDGIVLLSADVNNAAAGSYLGFQVDGTERARFFNTGSFRTFATNNCIVISDSTAAGTGSWLIEGRNSATAVNTGTACFDVLANGNVRNTNNSYGSLSDIKLKENIVDAGSQWADFKSFRIRKYNFKKETNHQTHTQIGLIAQEVELISPGLIYETPDRDEEGNDLGTVTKSINYSVLYMKAVKALQEAMIRIETLEAQNAAFEARLVALEGK